MPIVLGFLQIRSQLVAGVRCIVSLFLCGMRGFTSHNNIILQKKLTNKYTQKIGIFD